MLFWAVRSSCGGRLGWEVFRPKLARGRGAEAVTPCRSPLASFARIDGLWGLPEHLASENSRVRSRWVKLSNRGSSFPRLKDDLPLSGEPPVRS